MQALSHLPLTPDAPGLRVATSAATSAPGPAWQCALEKAQAAQWFDGALPGAAGGGGTSAHSEMQGAGAVAPAAVLLPPTAGRAAGLEQRGRAAAGPSTGASSLRGPIADYRNEAALRIHIESAPQGLCIWLGITGNAGSVARRSDAVLAQLRCEARAAPLRLARVVCNGHTLYAANAVPASPSTEEFP